MIAVQPPFVICRPQGLGVDPSVRKAIRADDVSMVAPWGDGVGIWRTVDASTSPCVIVSDSLDVVMAAVNAARRKTRS